MSGHGLISPLQREGIEETSGGQVIGAEVTACLFTRALPASTNSELTKATLSRRLQVWIMNGGDRGLNGGKEWNGVEAGV